MNTIWSDFVQSTGTLFLSRALRFSEEQKEKYLRAFQFDGNGRILEIGCGPGALAGALARWYPEAEITGMDRDTAFLEYAVQAVPGVSFVEGDIAALPFPDQSFDMVISNTVQEHVRPSDFFGEQYRILKPGGICLVLSARPGIRRTAPCVANRSDFEMSVWDRVEENCRNSLEKHQIGKYAMKESELPASMEEYGFCHVSTDYLAINLTPDNPGQSKERSGAIINADRQSELDAADSLIRIAPELVTEEEIRNMKRHINSRYDRRMELLSAGEKQWDTSVSLTMIVRGVKA